MNPLAHVVQVAICGGGVAGALAFLAAHWIHDALYPSMSATLGLGGEQLPDDETELPPVEDDRWTDGQLGAA